MNQTLEIKNKKAMLHTQRLLLRPFRESDIDNVFKGLSHPDVIRYYGVHYNTLEETRIQMQYFSDLEKNNTGQWWAICSTDDTVFYGGCGLNNINHQHRRGEIGYWLLPDYWSKGIISEALPLICNYGFTQFNLHRIEAVVETENHHSKKLITRMGFIYEGTMQDCEIKNGRFISLEMYALLNKENEIK